MFCKWITCAVDPGARPRFAAAQQGWSAIADQPGLIGQVGGWDPDTGKAHVLGVWDGRDSYDSFMHRRHDRVAEQAEQSGTYRQLTTAVGPTVFTIPGDAVSLPVALRDGSLLRVADCVVRTGHEAHFLAVQRSVWAPGMAAAGGMLAGLFTQLAPDRYLVTTWWSSTDAHTRYARQDVRALRQRAKADDDLSTLTGHVLELEARWRVLPGPSRR